MENPDFLYPVSPGRGRGTVLATCALVLTVGCAAPLATRRAPDPVRPDPPAPSPGGDASITLGVDHVVRSGQTLWRIARAYGIDVDELARVNDIDDPTRLAAGQVLFIPGATVALDVPAYVVPGARGRDEPSVEHEDGTWAWPVSRPRLLSAFGAPRRARRHQGIDLRGESGDPMVLASRAGLVVYSGSGMSGYGRTVILDHGDGTKSLYAHNSRLLVENGQRVERGQPIARIGRTGNATAVHCHFEIHEQGRPVDPLRYLESTREARR